MIPKVIHYCWFGRNPKPELVQRCMRSWKKYCPDYQIIEWNEDNFDIHCNDYVREAYEAKKWAFVTDFVRLWVVYHHGGIYLDTDVEIIKSLDPLLNDPAFFGFEDEHSIATGLGFGAEKENPVVKYMLQDYSEIHYLHPDGSYDKTPCPVRNTKAIAHLFPKNTDSNTIVKLADAIIYPKEYFSPLSSDCITLRKTKNTYSIHWFSASWLSEQEQVVHEWRIFLGKCEKYFGKRLGRIIARVIYLFRPQKRSILKMHSSN